MLRHSSRTSAHCICFPNEFGAVISKRFCQTYSHGPVTWVPTTSPGPDQLCSFNIQQYFWEISGFSIFLLSLLFALPIVVKADFHEDIYSIIKRQLYLHMRSTALRKFLDRAKPDNLHFSGIDMSALIIYPLLCKIYFQRRTSICGAYLTRV